MPIQKKRQKTINTLKKELSSIGELYKADCVNWSGQTIDTNEYYSEIIANKILKNLTIFNQIQTITRKRTYNVQSHNNININLESNRAEEIFAKRIANLNIDNLGEIIDYQIPLKSKRDDKGVGKIDLLSYNKNIKELYLHELKYRGNNETLLRAILEVYTYYKIIDQSKLKKDCLEITATNNVKVQPSVLVVPECKPWKELQELKERKRPKTKALALALDIKFFTIELSSNEITI